MSKTLHIVSISIAFLALVGCVTAPETDWRNRTAVLEMAPLDSPGAIGYLTVVGTVYSHAFTSDALWVVIATARTGANTAGLLPVHTLAKVELASNRYTELHSVGGFAHASLAAGDGAVWLSEGVGGDKVHRIDPHTNEIVTSIEVPRNPISIAVGEGAVWVLASERANKVGRVLISVSGWALFKIDPMTNAIELVRSVPASIDLRKNEVANVYVAAGSIWVSTSNGEILKVDPSTANIVATFSDQEKAAAALEPGISRMTEEKNALLKMANERLGHSAYSAAEGMGTLWAFSTNRSTAQNERRLTWITRLRP